MAIVTAFEKVAKTPRHHPTTVTCYWSILPDKGHGPLLQIDTRGSGEREIPGKQSQTLQLTANSARELFQILKTEFEF
jgi:hypothetical protein